MSQSMSPRPSRDVMIDAGLAALARGGMAELKSMGFLAEIDADTTDLRREFGDAYGLVLAALRRLNGAVLDAVDHLEADDTPRERFFELFMARFDAAEPHRAAIAAIMATAPRDPQMGLVLLQAGDELMHIILEAVGLHSEGGLGHLRGAGLAGLVYLPTVRVWLKDETQDMAKTMAELDRSLARVERTMSRLGGLGRRLTGDLPGPAARDAGDMAGPVSDPSSAGPTIDATATSRSVH